MLSLLLSLFLCLSPLLLSADGAVARTLTRRTAGNGSVVLDVAASPSPGRQVVDAQFVSYSIEFPNWPDYAGNLSLVSLKSPAGPINLLTSISATRTSFRFNSLIT